VAPLMTPIMAAVLAIITSDREHLVRSVFLIVAGAAVAIVIGYLFGLLAPVDVVAETSSQVAARVNPRLIDLLAAIATGAAGAFAQCREDVSDTMPGVAIAISLVPPLVVVGLTAEAGEWTQSRGALLLFLTNVGAILLTGVIVMAIFRVTPTTVSATGKVLHRRRAVGVVVALVLALAVPLGVATVSLTREKTQRSSIASVARAWAAPNDWIIVDVQRVENSYTVVASGPLPSPNPADLRTALDNAGMTGTQVVLRLVPEEHVVLSGK